MLKRKNLVFVAAGKDSCFESYANSNDRNFDVFVNYYPEHLPPENFYKYEYFQHRKGIKLKLFKRTVEFRHKSLIEDYDYIWVPDDDIESTTENINKMFDLASELDLTVFQPALTADSYYSHAICLKRDFKFRNTNFVEIMCPCFSKKSMQEVLHTFSWSPSGWGLDWTWPKLLNFHNTGILDFTPVRHTRPVKSGDLYDMFKSKSINPGYKFGKILKAHTGGDRERKVLGHLS